MNLGELLAHAYDGFALPSPTSGEVRTRFVRRMNAAQRAILREPGLGRLRDTLNPLTFASEADRAIYGLPASLERVSAVTERDTDRQLEPMSLEELRATDPGLTQSGTPWAFVPLGFRALQEPPASTGLWAESTSASDTQTIEHNGIRSGGLATGDIATTLTGVTRVALGTLTDYVDVTAISLNLAAVGVVSILDASSSGNTLAQIGVGQTSPGYFCIQLVGTPSAAVTYYADGTLKIVDMQDNQDTPILPEPFHDILAEYASALEYRDKGDANRMASCMGVYQQGVSRLKYYVSTAPAEPIVLGRPTGRRFSRYGAMYPVGNL